MRLQRLLEVLPAREAAGPVPDPEIRAVRDDSRAVKEGDLFVAVRGSRWDGHDFVAEAVGRAAAAVVVERPVAAGAAVQIRVPDTAEALALLAARFHGDPAEDLLMVGVTGTNGKTTVAWLLQAVLAAWGRPAGRIGTLGYDAGDAELPAANTTPGALRLQELLARMRDRGRTACVMEVSSHALVQGRVRGCGFDVRIFTNLTRDHLDYHGTMEAYYRAKGRLFEPAYAKGDAVSVLPADDPWGRRLASEAGGRVVTYGASEGSDVRLLDFRAGLDGTALACATPRGRIEVTAALAGAFNAANLLAAVAAAEALGVPHQATVEALAGVPAVPGRFQLFRGPGFSVVVDYAHTDDALRRLLAAARELCGGRLLVVFGCGGDRDKGKRPLMGRAAAEAADRIVVTSDNPRTEDPAAIISQILEGIPEEAMDRVETVEDRREAIRRAVEQARTGDVVVVAGKGHEDYQIVGTRRYHLDDREEVRAALAGRERAAAGE